MPLIQFVLSLQDVSVLPNVACQSQSCHDEGMQRRWIHLLFRQLKNPGCIFTNTDRPVSLLTPRLSAGRRDYVRENVRSFLSACSRKSFRWKTARGIKLLL
ncbi:hypothetical protein DPMN_136915 [Dreissena polymorpha]|uniref:Uncharacterized protein n=1 Tax=Dreissena polymorpha TaxID=45954 RepID=A0A9D4G4H8_DREPO|nr:hypothetical protein DPMN_136915 [Dreissena polymorpha]